MIILNKRTLLPGRAFELLEIEALVEKATTIAKNLWLQNKYLWQGSWNNVETHLIDSETICLKYLP